MKEGDQFLDYHGNIYTFLEYYNEGRDSDFLAKDANGKLRNFMEDQVKTKVYSEEELAELKIVNEKIQKLGL